MVLYTETLRSVVLSPLANFWVGILSSNHAGAKVSAGIKQTVESIPKGFEHASVLVAGHGINDTLVAWGDVLLAIGGKPRTNPYNDFVLAHLGYWTDNGAYYYHNHYGFKNAEEALLAVKAGLEARSIPIHYVQWDDWWMFLAGGSDVGGLTNWQPMPDVFPSGLTSWLGVPLSLYVPMYNPHNVYRAKYNWKVDDTNHAIPMDEQFYRDMFSNGTRAGMRHFEQDFLCTHNTGTHLTNRDVYTGAKWLEAMGNAALALNITLQYCMMDPYVWVGYARRLGAMMCVSG